MAARGTQETESGVIEKRLEQIKRTETDVEAIEQYCIRVRHKLSFPINIQV